MEFGVRAHDLGTETVEVLSKRIHEKEFTSVHLAIEKAISGMEQSSGKLSPGLGKHIKAGMLQNNIKIAILGCYINMIHPDQAEREKSICKFKEYIRYAKDFGCSIIGSETGSYNADCSYNEGNGSEEAFSMCVKTI